jgi:hypothetical protein
MHCILVGGATKSQNGRNYLIHLHPSSRASQAKSHTQGTAPLLQVSISVASELRKMWGKGHTGTWSTGNYGS